MDYSKEINETPKSYFKKESAPYLEPSNNINQDQSMGQNIVENQQQTLRQQPQSAQNEFDYYPQEQIAPHQQAPQITFIQIILTNLKKQVQEKL